LRRAQAAERSPRSRPLEPQPRRGRAGAGRGHAAHHREAREAPSASARRAFVTRTSVAASLERGGEVAARVPASSGPCAPHEPRHGRLEPAEGEAVSRARCRAAAANASRARAPASFASAGPPGYGRPSSLPLPCRTPAHRVVGGLAEELRRRAPPSTR
jgi:hypothetical protein